VLKVALTVALTVPSTAFAQSKAQQPKSAQSGRSVSPGSADQPLPPAQSRDLNLRAYVELLRSDLRTEKVAVITQMMHFTDAEDRAFWPVYRAYELELSRLNDDRIRGIETYSKTYASLTDATADDLMTKALDLEARRTALLQKYYTKLKAAVSPLTAARALQVERQILLLLDLQIAASLPVVPATE
jgi:hypothetical protein